MADTASIVNAAPSSLRTIALRVTDLTPDSFAPYGQVIDPQPDGAPFGPHDAQLDLSRGIPRFYLMRLRGRKLRFTRITHHANTTQCLGSINGKPWYLGVTRPTIVGEEVGSEQALKGDGYVYLPPDVEDVRVFRVDGPRFLKLHRGTWHAGPLFEEPWMDFYNLELSKTNEGTVKMGRMPSDYCKNGDVKDLCTLKSSSQLGSVLIMIRNEHNLMKEVDHTTYNFEKNKGILFEVEKPCS